MALFVAKFLETQTGRRGSFTESWEASPRAHAAQESIQVKLAKLLKKRGNGPPCRQRPDTDELERMLSAAVQRQGESVVTPTHTYGHGWNEEVVRTLAGLSIQESAEPEEMINDCIAQLEDKLRVQEKAALQREMDDARRLENVRKSIDTIYSKAPFSLNSLTDIDREVASISAVLQPNKAVVTKGQFLESVLMCSQITDDLHRIPKSEMLTRGDEFVKALADVASVRRSLVGRSRDVIDSRMTLLVNSFVSQLTSHMHEPSTTAEAYRLLRHITHKTDPFRIQALLFVPKIKKFDYHFTRVGSPLNLPDKPEWPLRWFVDLASETAEEMGKDVQVELYLARTSKEFFRAHRWASIRDPRSADESQLFSLYLSKFLQSANQWKDLFGTAVSDEFMGDIIGNTAVGVGDSSWSILDEWIFHDRSHVEAALDTTKDPFKPSQFNQAVCNLVQTLIDMFDSLNARLECIKHDRATLTYFVESCHDDLIRELLYRVRVDMRDAGEPHDSNLMKTSLEHLFDSIERASLVSSSIRRQVLDLSNQV